MNSVLQLGYGPVSSEGLAQLEDEGRIISYLDGSVIKFMRNPNAPTTATKSPMTPTLNAIGLIGR